jgi:malate dehydrogenase (oxaloacetate-decarboxylating)(NADP+)
VTNDRGDKLADHKLYFSRDDNKGQQFKNMINLIDHVKPTILMGLSTIGGAFTAEILRKMKDLNQHPIIFPLSNPVSKSECTFEEAVINTDGQCLFASGSPFPEFEYKGKRLYPGQGNNMYVFPGIGLAAILCKAVNVTQDMIYASGEYLSHALTPLEKEHKLLYPDITRIREVSVVVTRGVIRAAQKNGVDRELAMRNLSDEQLDDYIRERMYDPFKELTHIQNEIAELHQTRNGSVAAPAVVSASHL